MTEPSTMPNACEHFAQCVQILGGTTASARRLGIDERAIRRFINGERPISDTLLKDTATALQRLVADASTAERQIAAALGSESDKA